MAFPKETQLSLSTADFTECIPSTEHSFHSLLNALHVGCPQFAQMEMAHGPVQMVKAESIDGSGLMSIIFRIIIFLKNDQHFEAILKITTTQKLLKMVKNEEEKKANDGPNKIEELQKFFFEIAECEANFYEMVIPSVPEDLRRILPRAYAINRSPDKKKLERGFILMEDLAPKGVIPDLYEGLREEQVQSALLNLAKFHASSMGFSSELIGHFEDQHSWSMKGMEAEMLDRLLKMNSPFFLEHQKTLGYFILANSRFKRDLHIKFGMRPVLCHGDFWANNLFFERHENGNAGNELCAIVDWQGTHTNTGLNDAIRLIYTGVNAKLREQKMWKWLDFYFDMLQKEARQLSIQPVPEYSAELRRKLYAEQSNFEVIFTFLITPTLFPGAKTEKQRRNLLGRMESLFEERRAEYEQILKEKERKAEIK